MKAKTKTFKIGESCEGGILKVDISKGQIIITCMDWFTKKEIRKCYFREDDKQDMERHLWDMTTSYYTDQVMKYIKENTSQKVTSW